MVEKACAVIVADEGSLLEVAGASSLAHLVSVARSAARIRDLVVMTANDAVRGVAQRLGVPTIEDQILTRVPVNWARDRATQGTPSTPPSAAPQSIPKRQIPLGLRASVAESVVVAAPTTLLESEKYDALLLLNGAKPLVDVSLVNATLDALRGAGTVVLVADVPRAWRRASAGPGHVRIEEQQFADLEAVYGVRLLHADAYVEVVVTGPEAGWDVREALQYAAIAAAFAERRKLQQLAQLPEVVSGLVMDFDGVFTDNAVWLDEHGTEAVRCHRGDGLGLGLLREAGLPMAVISKERNPVVKARCAKLFIECFQGVDDKLSVLTAWAAAKGIAQRELLYIGNDVNDLECLVWAGCGVVVADAHHDVMPVADLVLSQNGGHGALRELADLVRERVRGYFPLAAR